MVLRANEQLCKIIYFDEESVTDYIQIVVGGQEERIEESKVQAEDYSVNGLKSKWGFGASLKAIFKFNAQIGGDAEFGKQSSEKDLTKCIITNTILTDFIAMINSDEALAINSAIKKFGGFKITAPENSFAYMVLVIPYLAMIKGGTTIPAGEVSISTDRLDNALKAAKGYYEFVGTNLNNPKEKYIFRFNIKSFRNNYRAADLLKMNVAMYAIKVGQSSLDMLNIQNELNIEPIHKDNPDYVKKASNTRRKKANELLMDVYDVLLAGVEFSV